MGVDAGSLPVVANGARPDFFPESFSKFCPPCPSSRKGTAAPISSSKPVSTSSVGKKFGIVQAELEEAREQGKVLDTLADFPGAGAKLDGGLALESDWVDHDVRFSSSKGCFGLQFALSPVEGQDRAWKLLARVKPLYMVYGREGQDATTHWAARVAFQLGSSSQVCDVIPDHRMKNEGEDYSCRKVYVREMCCGTFLLNDAVLVELHSTGALALSLHVAVNDAGGPLEEEMQYGCGCCA